MEKIFNYVKNGKGMGLLFLMATAVLVTLSFSLVFKDVYQKVKPEVLTVAGEFLPITVENGRIVSPADTYKKIDFDFGGTQNKKDVFPIVLDTRSETSAVPEAKQGLFIMSDMVYAVSANKINRIALQDGVLDQEKFAELLDIYSGYFSAVMVVIMVAMLFFGYLLKSWLAALVCRLVLKAASMADAFSFSALMRLSSVLTAGVAVASLALNQMASFDLSNFQSFVLIVILEVLLLFRDKKQQQ